MPLPLIPRPHRVATCQPAASNFIIGVDDCLTVMVGGISIHLPPVMRHIAMIAEMVAAQISKHGGGQISAPPRDAAPGREIYLHRAEGRALRNQIGQHMLNIHSGTGCVLRRDHFYPTVRCSRSHHCAGSPSKLAHCASSCGGGPAIAPVTATRRMFSHAHMVKRARQRR